MFRSFVSADVDYDGVVSIEEFDGMIEAAAALPRYRPTLDIGCIKVQIDNPGYVSF